MTVPAAPESPRDLAPPPRRWLERLRFGAYVGHLLGIGALGVSNSLLGIAFLVAPWRRELRRVGRFAAPLLVPLGAYALLLILSVAFSYEPAVSRARLSELFSLSTLLLALMLVRGERRVRWVVDGLILVGVALAGWGLAQYLVGYGDLARRIRGPFSHYMTFAGVLLLCDVLLLARLAYGPRPKAWRWVALALLNLGVIGSLTRSAWVGLGVAMAVLVLARKPRWLVVIAPVMLLLALVAPASWRERATSITDLSDPSNYDRLCMANAGLYMIAERPLFGIGPDLVERRYSIYRHPTAPRYSVPHLHSSLLQLTAERGLLSLGAYAWLTIAVGMQAWRAYQLEGDRRGRRADLYIGILLALLAFNVAGLFEDNWGDTEVQRVALFLMAVPFCLVPEDDA